MATLTLDHVTKVYRPKGYENVLAVDAVSMEIADGEIIALLGSSGCGKTSTLRMIAGFEDITDGRIRIGDRVINGLPASRRNVAMAFEGYALYPPLTIWNNIAFSLLREKMPRATVEAKVREVAELLQIDDILHRYPPTLSGGQQQRVSLARALVRKAGVYLLDEPMSQLEPQLRAVIRARLKDYLTHNGMTTVFVTHDQTEAVALSDRIAVMEEGVLQQFASPDELKNAPANMFVASFVGEPAMNILSGEIQRQDGRLVVQARRDDGAPGLSLALPDAMLNAAGRDVLTEGRRVYLGLRPHKLAFAGVNEAATTVTGQLVSYQWLGDQSHLGIDVNGNFLIGVTDEPIDAAMDGQITFGVPLAAIHLFDGDTEAAIIHGDSTVEAVTG